MEFKDILKRRRKELGLTLEEVGKAVGVSKPTVQRWESGNIRNIRRDKIFTLSKVLKISTGELMGWEDYKSSESISSRIQTIMKYKNITLDRLAELTGIDISTLSSYINHTDDFHKNDEILKRICNVLNISIDCLFSYCTISDDAYENYIGFLYDKIDKELPLNTEENKILLNYINDDGFNNAPTISKFVSTNQDVDIQFSAKDLEILKLLSSLPADKLQQAIDYLRFLAASATDAENQ